MGAWGYELFDDDTAYDYIDQIGNSDNPKEIFRNAFETAINADYLEYDECHAVIVSASYIDSILNGTKPIKDAEDGIFYQFIEKNKTLNVSDLKTDAVKALERVIGNNSELNELWAENEELYPKWKANIDDLVKRLR
ncbi:MAG TPA: DUF4259 domain-containing protein [Aquella sp.]|nr:DUF4259 domain-containing protein [Aquella sp.]